VAVEGNHSQSLGVHFDTEDRHSWEVVPGAYQEEDRSSMVRVHVLLEVDHCRSSLVWVVVVLMKVSLVELPQKETVLGRPSFAD
jgi:hypothetical protein